ncbi:hypothetical protein VP01_1810g1 [Puccinia sorghi]|uniref:DUF659 domain-containing protein n=1 Tax=Puccinia sorghi TaxID=27349 RepID=A0A0L6VG10_9BASI|nr:hypothetical protein VP01_1810g1 [Puccinia sorghi]
MSCISRKGRVFWKIEVVQDQYNKVSRNRILRHLRISANVKPYRNKFASVQSQCKPEGVGFHKPEASINLVVGAPGSQLSSLGSAKQSSRSKVGWRFNVKSVKGPAPEARTSSFWTSKMPGTCTKITAELKAEYIQEVLKPSNFSFDTREINQLSERFILANEKQKNNLLLKSIIISNVPLTFLKNPYFQSIRPYWHIHPPTMEIFETLKEQNQLTLTMDGWANNSGNSLYTLMLLKGAKKNFIEVHQGESTGLEITLCLKCVQSNCKADCESCQYEIFFQRKQRNCVNHFSMAGFWKGHLSTSTSSILLKPSAKTTGTPWLYHS